MPRVIVDHPVPPEGSHSVEVQTDAAPTGSYARRFTRRGIKRDPTIAWEKPLHPGVGVAGTDHILRGHIVEFAGPEPVNEASGDPHAPQHHSHGGGEIFTVPLFTFEEEVGKRITRYSTR